MNELWEKQHLVGDCKYVTSTVQALQKLKRVTAHKRTTRKSEKEKRWNQRARYNSGPSQAQTPLHHNGRGSYLYCLSADWEDKMKNTNILDMWKPLCICRDILLYTGPFWLTSYPLTPPAICSAMGCAVFSCTHITARSVWPFSTELVCTTNFKTYSQDQFLSCSNSPDSELFLIMLFGI